MRLIALALLCLLSSCSLKMIPLKGDYPALPITASTATPVDQVWEHLIDYISQRGLSVKIIDRSSGFLVMDDCSFKGVYTTEDKRGIIRDRQAFLVSSSYKMPSTMDMGGPSRIMGNFNVRVKKQGAETLINVNLTNLRAYGVTTSKGVTTFHEAVDYQIKSTGVFEKMIIDYIK